MTDKEFVRKLKDIAEHFQTVYMMGTFGAPVSEGLIQQKVRQYPKYYSTGRQRLLRGKIGSAPWAFDCVGLIKGVLWGWVGDRSRNFGGAKYRSNTVPDVSANGMTKRLTERSEDMAHILPGEAVSMDGHIGIYVGDGKVVEATLTGKYDGIVITDLSYRPWESHGKLPWVEYAKEEAPKPPEKPKVGDTVIFSGGKHYVSSNGNLGFKARPGKAKITRYLPGKKHPYHLIHTDRESNVYGWVDEGTVTS